MIFLDTDVVIDFLRGNSQAQAWLLALGAEEIGISGFVALELLQGCTNKHSQAKVEKLIAQFRIEWASSQAYKNALETYKQFHLSHAIGMIDILIGHIAVELDVPLYTFNQKHYRLIDGLATIQPYSR